MARGSADTRQVHPTEAPPPKAPLLQRLTAPLHGSLAPVSFGLGRGADGIKSDAFTVFLIPFYAVVIGVDPLLVGFILALAILVDAVTDPLMSWWSDHFRSPLGRRHPFIYAAPVPLCAFYLGLWMPPDALVQQLHAGDSLGMALWIGCMAVGVRVSLTLYNIPHLALMPEISPGYQGRVVLSGLGYFFGWAFGLFSALMAYRVIFVDRPGFANGLLDPSGFAEFGVFGALVMAALIWLTAAGTHHRIRDLRAAPPPTGGPFSVFANLGEAMRASSSFVGLLFVSLCSVAAFRLTQALQIPLNTLFWGLQPQEISLLVLTVALGTVLALVVAWFATRFFDKAPSVLLLGLGYALVSPAPVVLRLMGVFPENDAPNFLPTLLGFVLVAATLGIGASVVAGSMMADITDEYELRFGTRREGMFYATQAFLAKLAAALGVIFSGFALDLVGIPRGATPEQVSAESLRTLGLLEGPVAAGISLLGLSGLLLYRISRRRHREIQVALRLRNMNAAAG